MGTAHTRADGRARFSTPRFLNDYPDDCDMLNHFRTDVAGLRSVETEQVYANPVSAPSNGPIGLAYRTVLDRTASTAELAYWTKVGWSASHRGLLIATSTEGRRVEARRIIESISGPSVDDASVVDYAL